MNLGEWQSRLQEHFALLRKDRSATAHDQPIFALEHGLTLDERDELAVAIREHIRTHPPSRAHSLPWIVYAAELGYKYSGDEYWHTFEAETTGWSNLPHRDTREWIRDRFHEFHNEFGGAMPTGAWAHHFSIICWPITHALLPVDLQRQLARLLYDLRHLFSPDVIASPKELGDLIASRSDATTSRFQQLTQEPRFLGQIACALLLEGSGLTSSRIYPATLTRIRADLDREHRSRVWLQSARDTATHRFSFGRSTGRPVARGEGGESRPSRTLSVAPRLLLRPVKSSEWRLALVFHDMSTTAEVHPHVNEVLTKSACRMNGTTYRIARGRLLRGSQEIPLEKWPGAHTPLLHFDHASSDIEEFFGKECVIRRGPLWLFKIASDGLAHAIRGHVVRPGNRYILLHEVNYEGRIPKACEPVTTTCTGVKAHLLQMPHVVTNDLHADLASLGIQQVETVQVWPVGLCATHWDGEGQLEWLSTDSPCIAIRADYQTERYEIALDETDVLVLHPETSGATVFAELPELQAGMYELSVQCVAQGRVKESATLPVTIRNPRIWIPGAGTEGAFCVLVDPSTPKLEEIWDGTISLQAFGPPHCRIHCDIEVHGDANDNLLLQKTLPPLALPVTPAQWNHHFGNNFRNHQDVENAFDVARSIRLTFWTDSLGIHTLVAERRFDPLRWLLQKSREGMSLRLIDDTGGSDTCELARYEFRRPDHVIQLDGTAFTTDWQRGGAPGLYRARTKHHRQSIILPAEVRTWGDLNIEPRAQFYERTTERLVSLIDVLDAWASARVPGNVVAVSMRDKVVRLLTQILFQVIGEAGWSYTERAMSEQQDEAGILATVRDQSVLKLIRAISVRGEELRDMSPRRLVQYFAGLAESHVLESNAESPDAASNRNSLLWASEFAMRLASGSIDVCTWAKELLHAGVNFLLGAPSLARAARVFVFVVDARTTQNETPSMDKRRHWGWQ